MAKDVITWSDLIKPDSSLKELSDMLTRVEKRYHKLSKSVISNSEDMKKALQGISAAGSKAHNVAGLTRQAQDVKLVVNEMQNMLKAMAQAKAAAANMTTDMLGSSSSVKALTQALKDNENAFRSLGLEEKNAALSTGEYLDRVSSFRVQIEATARALRTFATEQKKETILNAEIEKTVLKLTDAERKLVFETVKREQASKRGKKLLEAEARVAAAAKGSYEQLAAQIARNRILLDQMSEAEYKAASKKNGLVDKTKAMQNQLSQFNEAVGNYSRNLSHYSKIWSGFDYSVAQIIREVPNFAISARTFIMAISNNIATLGDEIKVFRDQQAQLRAEGKPTIGLFQRILQSLTSWNTALMIGVTILTAYGEAWLKAFKDWATGADKLTGLQQAMYNVMDRVKVKGINDSMGGLRYSFTKLREDWKLLETEADKLAWIERNRDAFKELGVSILDVADADKVFLESSEKMIQIINLRSKASVAEQVARDKNAEMIKKQLEAEDMKKKALYRDLSWWDNVKYFFSIDDAQERFSAIQSPSQKQELVKTFRRKDYQDLFTAMGEDRDLAMRVDLFIDYQEFMRKEVVNAEDKIKNLYALQRQWERQAADLFKNVNSVSDEAQEQWKEVMASGKVNRENTVLNFDQNKFYQHGLKERKFKFKDYKEETGGGESDGESDGGIDLEEWYARVKEHYRHKESTAEAKADEDDMERKIKLIDERYAHERARIGEIRREAQAILDGKKKVKGGAITQDQRQRLEGLVSQYSSILKSFDEAREREIQDVREKYLLKQYQHEKEIIDLRLKGVEKESEDEMQLLRKRLEMEKKIALFKNSLRSESERMSESDINAAFDLQLRDLEQRELAIIRKRDTETYKASRSQQKQKRINERGLVGFNKRQQDLYDIDTQKGLLEKEQQRLLDELNYTTDPNKKELLNEQLHGLHAQFADLENQEKSKKGVRGLVGSISERGLLGGILEHAGVKEDMIKSVVSSVDIIKSNISSLIDSYVELADAAVKAQEKQVDAAQKVVDAELEASKQGYANNVAQAQADLALEREKLKEQNKNKASALKAQRAMDTASAASSLAVATASIWKAAFESAGIAAPIVAAALTAGMFASFIATKIKAKQVSQMEAEYGDGGLEFLEGGSHASGNDINLHTKNRDGKNMRAEGGEALAIINRRNTRKYKRILPDVIDSLNKGVFEDKYLNAFEGGAHLYAQILSQPINTGPDLSGLESKLDKLIQQGNTKIISLSDGRVIEQNGNVKRIIKKL